MDNLFLKGYEAAKAAGLSDEKILADLSRHPVYGPMIQQGSDAGISGAAIMSGLKSGTLGKMVNPEYEKRSFLEGVGRGAEDISSGITGLIPGSLGDSYTASAADRAKVYDKANKDIGFDGGRVAGQVAALSPLIRLSPKAGASTMQRVATNAAVGAVGGFIPREESIGQRLTNAAIGGVLGGTVPELVRGGINAGSKLVRNAKAAFSDVSGAVDDAMASAAPQVASQAAPMLTSQADDAAVASTRDYLAQLATQQLKATGKVDQEALSRAAKVMAVNPELRPTLGQITRDPAIYSAEKNLMKSGTEAGNLVSKRFQEQESQLRQAAKGMVDSTGGEPLTDYAFGGKAGGVLRNKWKQMQEGVSAAYKAAEQQYGDVPVDVGDLVTGIANKAYTEGQETASGRMANIAMNRLKSFGLFDESGNLKEGANLSIQQLRDLRQTLNSIDSLTGATPDQAINAKMGVINAIDDAVGNSAVGDVFKPARDAARARFGEFADRTMNRIRTGQVPDDKLFDLATGRNVDTAKDFAEALRTGTPEQMAAGEQVMKDTQRKLIAQVLAKGQRGPMGEEAFYPASLRNALNPDLNGYQPEVLDALLTPDQVGGLRNFSQVVDILRADPAHNSINQSGSGALTAGLMNGGEAALVNRLGGAADIAPGIIGGAVKGAIGASKEAQQQALAKALLSGNPAAVPGIDRAVLESILSPSSPAKAALIRALLQGPAISGTAAVTGNQ